MLALYPESYILREQNARWKRIWKSTERSCAEELVWTTICILYFLASAAFNAVCGDWFALFSAGVASGLGAWIAYIRAERQRAKELQELQFETSDDFIRAINEHL